MAEPSEEHRAVAEMLASLAVIRYLERLDAVEALYEGPWERWRLRLLDWGRGAGPVREQLAEYCARREYAWRVRYAAECVRPPDRWRRRMTRA